MECHDEIQRLRETLRRWGQLHVLNELTADGADTSTTGGHEELQRQLLHFERWYPNGLNSYLTTATQLFREQQGGSTPQTATADTTNHDLPAPASSDPFASWIPSVPNDSYGLLSLNDTSKLLELEAIGLQHAEHCAFVVVAGGLGERLGYNGIKLALPVETITRTSYIETYIQHIQALQTHLTTAGRSDVRIPLAIMTSDTTHSATEAFLHKHNWFGMPRTQITLLKQDTVPCLEAVGDPQAAGGLSLRLVMNPHTNALEMKPHGHGDVHTLLHTSGLAKKWLQTENKTHVHFIQDTNALILNSTLPLLGASASNNWKWTFTVVPRKAKDASGAIVQFTPPHTADPGNAALFNVEYHELDHFLRSQAGDLFCDGDTNDPITGFSPFPGNINHFVAELASYVAVLDSSQGKTPEIFNPKYQSNNSGLFKSPARLECMMQDFPKLMASSRAAHTAIGLLSFPSSLVYSPCKNDTASAAAKVALDIPPQCAGSSEHDLFALNRAKLGQIGVHFSDQDPGIAGARHEWLGIPVPPSARGPHVVWTPSFAVSLASLAQRFPSPAQVEITTRSTLIVCGPGAAGVTFSTLRLDGALKITVCNGAYVDVCGLQVTNAGCQYVPVEGRVDVRLDAVDAMRGYRLEAAEVMEVTLDTPGRYTINEVGSIIQQPAQ